MSSASPSQIYGTGIHETYLVVYCTFCICFGTPDFT